MNSADGCRCLKDFPGGGVFLTANGKVMKVAFLFICRVIVISLKLIITTQLRY